MKKTFTGGTVFALALLVATATYIITFASTYNKFSEETTLFQTEREEVEKFIEVRKTIREQFVGEVDDEKLMDGALRGMVGALGDQYSHYLSVEEYEEFLQDSSGQYVGIGVSVGLSEEGNLVVTEVIDGSSAQACGISPLDQIVAVEGKVVSQMGFQAAISAMAGAENTWVRLTVRRARDGSEFDCEPQRQQLNRQIVSSEIFGGLNLGLVRIRSFDKNMNIDFIEAVTLLQNAGVRGIIFDVRNNPGGQLDALCPSLDLLLPEGTIITIRDKKGAEKPYLSDAGEVDLPMVVLVNEHSYSAAEFFAAALKDYGKATIVGEATTGKGFAQEPLPLKDNSALYLSTRGYFTPNGKSLAGVGLTPDVEVPLTAEEKLRFYTMTLEQDRQMQKAIEILTARDQEPQEELQEG